MRGGGAGVSTKKSNINPLALIACKQQVGQEDTDAIALPVLLHLDAAKRGRCTAAGCNHLTSHLITASYIAAATKSKAFHEAVTKAYSMLEKAAARPTDELDLTTTEYQAIRTAISWYLRSLPRIEVGMLSQACAASAKMMGV